mmetsp:Transcript_112317/g.204180  ORF Transcript_112317/g.204180 Transcript_112317/m.204180 type:complete len:194 (+) Transcript_112317:119-700(+)
MFSCVDKPASSSVQGRFNEAAATNVDLENKLNQLTNNMYDRYNREHFSALTRANLEDVDWRVPRVVYCKDPKYNVRLDPRIAAQAQELKRVDGDKLQDELSIEAWENWRKELEPCNRSPPPLETYIKPGHKFMHVNPAYRREDDVWERRLELRTLDEAMRGDVTKPMPRPVLFAGDYENFKEGRYLKDDCPIA